MILSEGEGEAMSDPDIQQLLDKQAITEVLYRYCRGLDRMDRAMAAAVWHPGGTADYGPMFKGSGAAFLDWVWETHTHFSAHSHQIANILISVAPDGDSAYSEAYVTVTLRVPPTGGRVVDIVDRGRYVDRWSRRDGRWGIEHRHFVEDFQALYDMPLNAATDGSATTGRRNPEDPSYEVFGPGPR
jgi:hypothetical protein